MFRSFIRRSRKKVPSLLLLQCILRLFMKFDIAFITNRKYFLFFFILHYSLISGFSTPLKNNQKISFLMIYETNKPVDVKQAILYFSQHKLFSQKQDSLVLNFTKGHGAPDSIVYDTLINEPVYLRLKLYTSTGALVSNIFHSLAVPSLYDTFVNDTELNVRPKLSTNDFSTSTSLTGLVLVILTILEMIIALLISRVFGMSRIIILMVLTANIAAFPLYLLNIQEIWVLELLVLFVKALVMSLIGMRKIHLYKIILLLIVLTIISFGIKEILFFLIRIV
jgi:hypothetical protein